MGKRVLIPTLIILIFLGGLLFVSFQTGIPQIFWKVQKQRENITQKPKHSPLVTEFYRRAQNDLTPEDVGFSAQQYVSKLQPQSGDTILISGWAPAFSLASAVAGYDPRPFQAFPQNRRFPRVSRSSHGAGGSRSPLRIRRPG